MRQFRGWEPDRIFGLSDSETDKICEILTEYDRHLTSYSTDCTKLGRHSRSVDSKFLHTLRVMFTGALEAHSFKQNWSQHNEQWNHSVTQKKAKIQYNLKDFTTKNTNVALTL